MFSPHSAEFSIKQSWVLPLQVGRVLGNVAVNNPWVGTVDPDSVLFCLRLRDTRCRLVLGNVTP